MADEKRTGKPVEEWIPVIKSDSSDYLDGPRPRYQGHDGEGLPPAPDEASPKTGKGTPPESDVVD